MPELPEVETIRRFLEPRVVGAGVVEVVVRNGRLRFPVPRDLGHRLRRNRIRGLRRRAKYLLIDFNGGACIVHLGMSGHLLFCSADEPAARHDHLDLILDNAHLLRFRDPRRFGCVLWAPGDPLCHSLLAALGPEPFSSPFSGDHLYQRSRGRRTSVKAFIMDGRTVAGVGNIYANEALFAAGIDPRRAAGRISRQRYRHLAAAVRTILRRAIAAGGTTIRDYTDAAGDPGYFQRSLAVYGKAGQPCPRCGAIIASLRIAQRATYLCRTCQR